MLTYRKESSGRSSAMGDAGHMQEVEFNELVQPCEEEGKGRPGRGYYLVRRYKFCLGMDSSRLRGHRHMLEWGKPY